MRVIRFILRNWPLKLGAIALAVILYGGMLVLQNARSWDNQIPIDALNEPPNVVLMDTLPPVTRIRFVAAADVPITRDSFKATIDLATVQPSESKQVLVAVKVEASDPRIQILDYDPQQINVRLEPLVSKSMKVTPNYTAPKGLTTGDPVVTPDTVTVLGAASDVAKVSIAQADVLIETSGLDVDRDFPVAAYDATGKEVQGVEFRPPSVHVKMTVGSEIRSVTLPVSPTIGGTPARGYIVTSVEVAPVTVELRGEAGALAPLHSIPTQPVSIAGATSDVTQQVPLALPDRVEAPGTSTVKVVVHVQAITETRTISVAVALDGARSDRGYTLATSQVLVTISGPVAALNALDTNSLVARVSVGNLGPGTYTVQVSLSSLPANIQLLRIEPASVSVTVTAAQQPSPSLPSPSP